jgi:hypothetical protein
MGLYAIVKGGIVDAVAIADSPLETDGIWICIDDMDPKPFRGWAYEDGVFSYEAPKVYVKKSTIRAVLSDVWEKIENAASSDDNVKQWLDKIALQESQEFTQQYIDELLSLVKGKLITLQQFEKLRPNSGFYIEIE